jgi:hypothetical protein
MRALACSTLLLVCPLPAQTVRTIVANGPTSNRYDVVILGDGYRDVEQARFDTDCASFAAALFNKDPYRTFGRYFNVHTVFRASRESGADHPDAVPPIVRDTVYDASYNTGGTARCLYIGNTSQALADAARAPANEGRILVMVNDSRYGGCASTFAVSYNGTSMSEVQIHEMGHSVGGLADEYWYAGQNWTGGEPGEPNATANPAGSKWAHWLGSNGIGVFQGCRYCERGLYRPLDDCLMRSLGRPLCSVCGESLVLRAHRAASAIDQPLPAASTVAVARPARAAFSFTNIAPASSNVLITWRLDGGQVAAATTSYSLDSTAVGLGRHTLEVEVLDRTPFVRSDPGSLLRQVRRWTVDVTDARPDLVVDAFAPSATTFPAGTPIDLATTVRNAGTLAAGAHDVSHFLSADPVLGTEDVYLGKADLAGLGASQSASPSRTAVRIPSYVVPGAWYLGAAVDFEGRVGESDEGNNVRLVPVQVGPPACAMALELRDALLYPKDRVTLRASGAPFTLPTVTSRCTPGETYLVVWGCSGRSPGTPIGGYTLPLNVDPCSLVSLSWRGPFASFLGVLDGQGIGRPTFSLLGVAWTVDLDTDLAALVLRRGDFQVLGVTNAVGVDLRQ